jgi:TonB family protein
MDRFDRATTRNRGRVRNWGWAVALCAASTAVFGQSAAIQSAEPQSFPRIEIATVEKFDELLERRKDMAWNIREMSADLGIDLAGRTLEQCADKYIYTPQIEAELVALRKRAGDQSQSGDKAGLDASLSQAAGIANRQLQQMVMLSAYFTVSTVVSAQESALRVVLEKSPVAEQQKARARIDPMVAAFRDGLDSTLAAVAPPPDAVPSAYLRSHTALVVAYNEERQRLAILAAQVDSKSGVAPLSRTRTSPCVPPYPKSSGSDRPQIDQSRLTQPDYPAEASRYGFEGSVVLTAEVSATGCVERVEIKRTVGYEPLDAAALLWAEGVRFHPAENKGQPVAGVATFAATFRLAD